MSLDVFQILELAFFIDSKDGVRVLKNAFSGGVVRQVLATLSSLAQSLARYPIRDISEQVFSFQEVEVILVTLAKEIEELTNLCSSMNLQIKKPSPFKEAVLSALNSYKRVHFAGHGFTDHSNPSKSHFLLKDWETEPLTIAKLLETNLRKQMPFLAYLSTCGTEQIKHDELIDESLHLISACQLSGFQHVIDTL